MRALVQRVSNANVKVNGEVIGDIGRGVLIFVCAMPGDTEAIAVNLATKISKLRIFTDDAGKMNLALPASGNAALIVSQFTLAADTSRGNRPGFSQAAAPDLAKSLYLHFGKSLEALGVETAYGKFGHEMEVNLTNDGPTTIWIDTDAP